MKKTTVSSEAFDSKAMEESSAFTVQIDFKLKESNDCFLVSDGDGVYTIRVKLPIDPENLPNNPLRPEFVDSLYSFGLNHEEVMSLSDKVYANMYRILALKKLQEGLIKE